MANTWITERFPRFESAMRQLTEQHRQLQDEPLHLALCYASEREPEDVFLLEVVGGHSDPLAENRELFETVFHATPAFSFTMQERIHLILTTPGEWQTALQEKWPSAEKIRNAVLRGDYKVLHADKVGQRLLTPLYRWNACAGNTAPEAIQYLTALRKTMGVTVDPLGCQLEERLASNELTVRV